MSIYETARNGFAILGLLTASGVIGLAVWHVVAAVRRRRATREARLSEQIKAKVQSQPVTRDAYGDTPLGI